MYVIYNKSSTKTHSVLRHGYWNEATYKTEAAAKAGLKREAKKGKLKLKEVAIAEIGHFRKNIEKTETRIGIVHAAGKKFVVSVNTPWTSGPWSETYWSS